MQSDCRIWTGPTAGSGYGVKSINGKLKYVHRLAWEEANGREIPPGLVVAHKCDTPACHNPDHLFVCTQAENLADMRAKGRGNTGERHGSKTKPERVARGSRVGTSKLTEADVAEIRRLYRPGKPGHRSEFSLTGLARRFGVNFQTISKIVNNHRWRTE